MYYNLEICLKSLRLNDQATFKGDSGCITVLDQAVTKSANFNHKTDITEKWNDSIDEEISQIDKYKYQQ